jgi:DNA-directed RNA polymerase subunit K
MPSKTKQPFPFKYTRFEKARIIGSRALQIAMGAPVLIESNAKSPMEIALEEFEKNAIPITVKRKSDSFIWLEKSDYF